MAYHPEKDGINERQPRIRFYWDDDFLGVQPSFHTLGSLHGRETILKEDVQGNPIVLYIDNQETCVLQTAAFYAIQAGYSNIGDFLLHNLELPLVADFLQDSHVRRALKAEFDFLSYNMRVLAAENEELHQESFESYQREEHQQMNLLYAAALLQFEEERADAIFRAYQELKKHVPDKNGLPQVSKKVDIFEQDVFFGKWLAGKKDEPIH